MLQGSMTATPIGVREGLLRFRDDGSRQVLHERRPTLRHAPRFWQGAAAGATAAVVQLWMSETEYATVTPVCVSGSHEDGSCSQDYPLPGTYAWARGVVTRATL